MRHRDGSATRIASILALLSLATACGGPQLPPSTVTATTVYEDTIPACAACPSELRPIASFVDSAFLRGAPVVEHDSRGRFYAAVENRSGAILMYDPSGRFVRTVGRVGLGPGEYRTVNAMRVGRGDSLFVIHDSRLTAYDTAGNVARAMRFESRLELPLDLVDVRDEGVIVSHLKQFSGADTLGLPLSVYDTSGRFVRAYGPLGVMGEFGESMELPRGVALHGLRASAISPDGSIWLQDVNYRFENVAAGGDIIRAYAVTTPPSWSMPLYTVSGTIIAQSRKRTTSSAPPAGPQPVPDTARPVRRPTRPPRSSISGFAMLSDTIMVVLVLVASPDWAKAEGHYDPATLHFVEDSPRLLPGYREQLHDTMVDIVNTSTGQLLSRTRVSGLMRISSDGTLYRNTFRSDGEIRVDAFALVPNLGQLLRRRGSVPRRP